MVFYDPEEGAVVTPREMVRALTVGGLKETSLEVEPVALLMVTEGDLRGAARRLKAKGHWAWRPYRRICKAPGVTVALSPFGAPNAVAVAEELYAFGARVFLFFGYCGSLREEVRAGDLVLPAEGVREEGTSYHYLPPDGVATASERVLGVLEGLCRREGVRSWRGKVWSTDAIYRETPGKVRRYAEGGCLGVEMEVTALLCWGKARGAEVGGLLVVSDELAGGRWRPKFRSPAFLMGRRRALNLAAKAALRLAEGRPRAPSAP